jgi:hypothetical protein
MTNEVNTESLRRESREGEESDSENGVLAILT